MERYYTTKEIEKGIEELPPISKTTLRNLRQERKIKYSKIGKNCVYKKSWILEYINKNAVETKTY
jgi:uncharacterized protein YneF (UPF0154 family)